MSKLGSADNRLKVAIAGAGPSGVYAADALINSELKVEMYTCREVVHHVD